MPLNAIKKVGLERTRFVEFQRVYNENTPKESATAQTPSTDSATAVQTMNSRKATLGEKGTSDSGVQSIKDAGKQRTQSGTVKK